MLTSGAIKSGLRISGFNPLGPLVENEATTGAGLMPIIVHLKSMVAVRFAEDETYDFTASPSLDSRAQAGKILITAIVVVGHENIPVIVAEIGWPSGGGEAGEVEANGVYVEMYIKELLMEKKTMELRLKVFFEMYKAVY
ncbi:hypothetical protein COLO4_03310 [Corchorus olitorius]|uniref:glucan endo-1,3-beta-D-glucosidase n=1 Tax=Corchorus olitorius TaxID=93759 RepID=A0A1R3KYZ4_9ROSI|nr:hypothetical protein COLO4_03310 [Corchorus olitorius]